MALESWRRNMTISDLISDHCSAPLCFIFYWRKSIVRTFSSQNCHKADGDTGGISIHNIGGVFVIIFFGVIVSVIGLIVEFYFYRLKAVNPFNFFSRKVGDSSVKKVAECGKKKNKWM